MTVTSKPRGRLDTDLLTLRQLGRIHAEFGRLGFHERSDRAERLRLTAIIARSGPIGSTKDLTMGQAGRVVYALAGCRTDVELYALAEPEPEPEPLTDVSFGAVIAALWAWITR